MVSGRLQPFTALRAWQTRLVEWGKPGLAVLWLAVGVLGGLNHRLWPDLYDQRGALPKLMPHLRYGYVMFDRMPRHFAVATYTEAGSPRQPLAGLVAPSSLGYEDARAFILLNAYPGFLRWLCHARAERVVPFELDRYRLERSLERASQQRFHCVGGELHGVGNTH
jgi:hypothetical protein